MEHKYLYKLLKKAGIPVAYDHFEDDEKNLEPPFMAYREKSPDNFRADNKVYSAFFHYEIELVTTKKDVDLENKISNLLTENEIPYEKLDEVWDSEEKIYHIFYEI